MALEMDRPQRAFVGVVLPAAYVGALVLPYLALRDRLPDPIAVHFDRHGAADGSMPVGAHLAVVALFVVPSALALVRSGWRPGSAGIEAPVAAFLGALLATVNVVVLLANRDQGHWRDATVGSGSVAAITMGALGAALPVALLVRHRRRTGAAPAPGVPLGDSERAAWFGRASSRTMATSVVLLLAAGSITIASFGAGAGATGLVLLGVGLTLVSFMSVDVAVGERGVRVRAGAHHWPRVRLPLEEIEAARATEWDPLRSGVVSGWGYRGSLRIFGRAGWVLRAGPALELDLTGGRTFVVTVDGAEEAAAVVNGLIGRQAGRTGR